MSGSLHANRQAQDYGATSIPLPSKGEAEGCRQCAISDQSSVIAAELICVNLSSSVAEWK
jgi:hypothetical protein